MIREALRVAGDAKDAMTNHGWSKLVEQPWSGTSIDYLLIQHQVT